MILKTKQSSDIPFSEVTPEHIYRSRREFMKAAAVGAIGAGAGGVLSACAMPEVEAAQGLKSTRNPKFIATDQLNTFEEITTYNNVY